MELFLRSCSTVNCPNLNLKVPHELSSDLVLQADWNRQETPGRNRFLDAIIQMQQKRNHDKTDI